MLYYCSHCNKFYDSILYRKISHPEPNPETDSRIIPLTYDTDTELRITYKYITIYDIIDNQYFICYKCNNKMTLYLLNHSPYNHISDDRGTSSIYFYKLTSSQMDDVKFIIKHINIPFNTLPLNTIIRIKNILHTHYHTLIK